MEWGDILKGILDSKNKSMFIETELELVLIENGVELSSVSDQDLMKIKCFSCHEGVNANNLDFPRTSLLNGYKTFIDKPLVISPDSNGLPRGHGYDFKKKKFLDKERLYIGHIVNAYPCIVSSLGEITDVTYMEETDFPDGELRIICEIVIYKQYMASMAETIAKLHFENKLKFSMESYCEYVTTEDGIEHCTSIHFTGLAIVNTPAFVNSFSLEIAQKEEEEDMDFEKLYNDEHAKVDTLIAEKTVLEGLRDTLVAEKTEVENTLLEVKEELVEVTGKLAEANSEIKNLEPYKEKIETAEKLLVGKERLEKITKYGKTDKTEEQLAEISKEEFVNVLAEAVDNYVPDSTAKNYKGLPNTNLTNQSKKDRLLSILSDFSK